jgi:uncharacterized RDD family membrane protein YckC
MSDDLQPAGLLRRLAALMYDSILLGGVLFVATAVLLPFHQGEAFQPNHVLYSGYLLGVGFVFFGWFWTHDGQTLGMRTWKIRVCRMDNGRLSWSQAGMRYLFAWVSLCLLGLGYLWILFNSEGRGWHDLVSGSKVIRYLPEKEAGSS